MLALPGPVGVSECVALFVTCNQVDLCHTPLSCRCSNINFAAILPAADLSNVEILCWILSMLFKVFENGAKFSLKSFS